MIVCHVSGRVRLHMPTRFFSRFLTASLLIVSSGAAFSAPIKGIFSTGVDSNGVTIAEFDVDPHYIISFTTDPLSTPRTYAHYNPAWAANSDKSRWIGPKGKPFD